MRAVRTKLATQTGKKEKELKLAPVPLTDGSAQLMLFDAKSGDAAGGKFVTRISRLASATGVLVASLATFVPLHVQNGPR